MCNFNFNLFFKTFKREGGEKRVEIPNIDQIGVKDYLMVSFCLH